MEPTGECAASHHHWLIDEPNGERSAGRCKHCLARRDFRNWLAEIDFVGKEESLVGGASTPYGGRGTLWRRYRSLQ